LEIRLEAIEIARKAVEAASDKQAGDIVGINSVIHGGTDYVIANGAKILKMGNYKKQNGKWTF
jgi:ribosomal silencing factor RsfS